MRFLVLFLFLLISCGGIQTEPTCLVEQFGIIKFTNLSDEYKQVYVFRLVHVGDSYKRVGKPHQRLIEPLTEGSLRIYPGLVLVIVDKVDGKRWGKIFEIRLCEVVRIQTKSTVCFRDLEPSIKSRRGNECPKMF